MPSFIERLQDTPSHKQRIQAPESSGAGPELSRLLQDRKLKISFGLLVAVMILFFATIFLGTMR